MFCDCDICRDEWEGMDFADIVGSDSDIFSDDDDDLYSYGADDRYNNFSVHRTYNFFLLYVYPALLASRNGYAIVTYSS